MSKANYVLLGTNKKEFFDSFSAKNITKNAVPENYSNVTVPYNSIGWQWYSMDLGDTSIIFTLNAYKVPESILVYVNSKTEIKKLQSIASTGLSNHDELQYYISPDKRDKTFLGFTKGNFWIYSVSTNSFNKFATTSKYNNIFNDYDHKNSTSPNLLQKIAKFGDTIILVSFNKSSKYTYIRKYLISTDDIYDNDSFQFQYFIDGSKYIPPCQIVNSNNIVFTIPVASRIITATTSKYHIDKLSIFNTNTNKFSFVTPPDKIPNGDGVLVSDKFYFTNSNSIIGHLNLSNYIWKIGVCC
jgi:hypothetical protein